MNRRGAFSIRRQRDSRGFSLIELMIVVGIILAVAVASTPTMVNVISAARMRGGITSLATFLQSSRGNAVRRNEYRSDYAVLVSSEYFVFEGVSSTTTPAVTTASGLIPMGKQVTYLGTPTGANAPAVLDNATAFGSSTVALSNGTITWNTRGMPCSYTSTTCNSTAFIWYFIFQPPLGSNRWGAMSVSPAGRIKAWYWDGSKWTN